MKNTSSSPALKYFGLVIPIFCLLILCVIFTSTSPDDTPPVVLLVIFILQYGLIFGIINGLFAFFEKIRKIFLSNFPAKKILSTKKKNSLIAFLSLVPIVILAIQSIKPISFYEIILILMATVFGVVLVYKKQL